MEVAVSAGASRRHPPDLRSVRDGRRIRDGFGGRRSRSRQNGRGPSRRDASIGGWVENSCRRRHRPGTGWRSSGGWEISDAARAAAARPGCRARACAARRRAPAGRRSARPRTRRPGTRGTRLIASWIDARRPAGRAAAISSSATGLRLVVVVAAEHAGEHREVGQHADRRGQRAGDRGDEDVAVVDVGQLVSEHALAAHARRAARGCLRCSRRRRCSGCGRSRTRWAPGWATTYSRGIGCRAEVASSRTIRYIAGCSTSLTPAARAWHAAPACRS